MYPFGPIAEFVDHPPTKAAVIIGGLWCTAFFGFVYLFCLAIALNQVWTSHVNGALAFGAEGIGGLSGIAAGWIRLTVPVSRLRKSRALRYLIQGGLLAGLITTLSLIGILGFAATPVSLLMSIPALLLLLATAGLPHAA
jgi:hypothetical protein